MLKREIHPGVFVVALGIVLVTIGWFYWREMGTVGGLPPGAVGRTGPFERGIVRMGGGGQRQTGAPAAQNGAQAAQPGTRGPSAR